MYPDAIISTEEIINQASELLKSIDNTLEKFRKLNTRPEPANNRGIYSAVTPSSSEKRAKLEANLALLEKADKELHQVIQERQENLNKPVSPPKHSF